MKYGVLILVMTLISGIFLFLVRQFIIVVSRLIEYDLKNEIYKQYQSLPLSFFGKNNTGDLMSRISEDVSAVRMYLGPSIMYFANLIILFTISIVIMYSVDAQLATYVLIPLPILALSIYLVHSKIDARSTLIQQGLGGLSTFVQEAFSGIRLLKTYVREDDSIAQFSKASNDYKDKSLQLTKVNSFFYPLILFLTGLSVIMIVFVGGKEVIKGNISYGNITEFIFYLNKLAWPVASLGWTTSLVQRAEAAQRRINEFLKIKSDIISGNTVRAKVEGNIRFDNVSFTYADSGIQALKNVSFEVKSGEVLAIIGGTGSGKSTIANLLCRLYDPIKGSISIDEIDLKNWDLNFIRNEMGYVPQDVFLFSDTIRNNIGFGSDLASEADILEASKMADLYDNIVQFPSGFDTILGERGITLSGGQKQRLSIARSLIRKPQMIILDDCLSAVDTQTESNILGHLSKIMEGKTSIIISHRVSTVKLASKIIVLDDGKIAESGSHQELLALNGLYKDMYYKQMEFAE
jgi:ATP-binding cassette subfamily B protein